MAHESGLESADKSVSELTEAVEDYDIDPQAEKWLRRKLDWRILPIVSICYMFLFLDRTNVGNAKSAGLAEDLRLGTYDFNIGASLFYVAYMLCEVPFALLIKRVGFHLVPISIIAFGAVTIASAFIHNKAGFYATRVFLGISEAVCYPGISYLLSRYYRRHELTSRFGCFMLVAAGGAGGFGGLLAAGLLSVGHIGSRSSWQNIFLVEGILTAACGLIMLFIFPTDPERTRMLTPGERKLAIARLYADQPSIAVTKERTTWSLVKRGILSPTTLACSWFFITTNISVQGLGVFLPSILKLNYPDVSTVHIQLLIVPVYIVAMIIALACCAGCVKYRIHWPFMLLSGSLCLTGYTISLAVPQTATKARYAACFLSLTGGFISGPIAVGWAVANASPDTLRAMVGAVVTGIGNIGAIAGIWAYVATDAPTGYHKGNSFNVAMAASLCVCCVGLALYQRGENAKRERGKRDYRLRREGVERLGNLHPAFRYMT
ncbi:MFS general substrate transporter [Schizophyllum commune Tattone D]|nr:MFS general substrate transporter [Schizophyllum commune Tattone D]